jgi:hypothetical protein
MNSMQQLIKISNLYVCIFIFSFSISTSRAQNITDTITVAESRQIINYLSSDRLKGRVNFTEGQIESAEFIGQYFSRLNLKPYSGYVDYYQPFVIEESSAAGVREPNDIICNGYKLSPEQYYYSFTLPEVNKKYLNNFKVVKMVEKLDAHTLRMYMKDSIPVLFWWMDQGDISTMVMDSVSQILGFAQKRVLLIAAPTLPTSLVIKSNNYFKENVLHNIVSVLPGKSKANEAIIFSAHYDHVSKDMRGRGGLFNGANDNASGVTALLQLAKYYSMLGPQERTIIFIAFAGEELGMFGSKVFTQKIQKEKIVSVVNIEMIGRHNKIGKRAIFITGQLVSSMPVIITRNLSGSKISVVPEKSIGKDLFARSDNFSFFAKGIPAHSIMSSDDDDPCYHQICDDAHSIDVENMTFIIQAISKGVSTLVNGTDTPVLYMKYEE